MRADLHRDLGEVNRALQNGEWKAATVLAGSILEAFLLWALKSKRNSDDIQKAAAKLGKIINLGKRSLDEWHLSDLIAFSEATGVISASTKSAADQCRDFRNLIHPGRAQRLAIKCSRATALLAVGAVEAVIGELS
jgi:HJR/Mrr/RecB family endonuclease